MEDVSGGKEEEEMFCEDYLTLVRSLREDEAKTPQHETFYPIDDNPGEFSKPPLEYSLWEPEKAHQGTDPSGQELRLVGIEYIAGPSCLDERGYNGHAISAAEMKHSTSYQMLAYKTPYWNPEPDGQEWEEDSECF